MRDLFYLLLIIIHFPIYGQVNLRTGPGGHVKQGTQQLSKPDVVIVQDNFTALAIRTDHFNGPSIKSEIDGDTLSIHYDPDAPSYTYFLSLQAGATGARILLDSGTYEIFTINSGSSPSINERYRSSSTGQCEDPFNSIPQSAWRAGLPVPNYTRLFTNVRHLVVHHSAGSNANTNYTQVVRDIYLLHTEVNGWSDIGYNYLVAQNGDIYDGRDPAGGDQDNVMGAHFCSANSNTMGICLLGNYETAEPTSMAVTSLKNVLTYKLNKENLFPFSQNTHALGQLDAIIGHRDGCSTLCPGENIYELMGQIKSDVMFKLENDCGAGEVVLDFSADVQIRDAGESISFFNQSSGYESYEWTFEGGDPYKADWTDSGKVRFEVPGLFEVSLVGYSPDRTDTITRKNYVEIQGSPVVYPNPGTAPGHLHVLHHFEIIDIQLITMTGSVLNISKIEEGTYQLPWLRPGVYVLSIQTRRKNYKSKIRIE